MTRVTVAILAAFEALITAAIGIGIALAPLTVVWAVQYHMTTGWATFWRAAVDAWLLGLGVDLHVHLDRVAALTVGLDGAVAAFTVTIAPLGIALFTLAMGARVGLRAAATRFVLTGAIASTAAFALAAWITALTADTKLVGPVTAQALPLAAATFGLGVLLGVGLDWARHRDDVPGWFARLGTADVRALTVAALRAGTGAVALLVAASAVFVALALFGHFGKIVSLYEGLQAGYLGGTTLTLAQLAFLPNAIVWAASWFVGPGFALGTAAIAPGGGAAGQLPGVPLLALVPAHTPAGAFVTIAIPVLAGAASGFLTHRRLVERDARLDLFAELALVAAGAAVFGGAILAALAAWSGGTLAPGALAHLGPNPWLVGCIGALELGAGAAIGLFAAHFRRQAQDWVPFAPEREDEREHEPV